MTDKGKDDVLLGEEEKFDCKTCCVGEKSEEGVIKVWFTELRPKIKIRNILTYYFAAFMTVGLAVSVNTLQPFFFSTYLDVTAVEQGSIAGTTVVVGELVMIPGFIFWGVVSDRIGRRNVYCLGFLLEGLGFFMFPLASSQGGLYAARAVWASGAAAATGMLATVLGDYVVDQDRGKATGIMGAMNGIGAAIGAVMLSKLPNFFDDIGLGSDSGKVQGSWTYGFVCALCVFTAIVLFFGMAGRESERESDEIVPVKDIINKGLNAGKKDKFILLAYLCAFVARADLAMAGVFIPQWSSSYHIEEAKLDAIQKVKDGYCNGIDENNNNINAPYYTAAEGEKVGNNIYSFTNTSRGCKEDEIEVERDGETVTDYSYTGYFGLFDKSMHCCADGIGAPCEESERIKEADGEEGFKVSCNYGFSCCSCIDRGDEFRGFDKCELGRPYKVDIAATAVARGGTMIIFIGVGGLISAPIFGQLADKYNRVQVVCWALLFNFLGYGMSAFVTDPTSGFAIVMTSVIGLGEVAGVITSQTLIQSQTELLGDEDAKGAIIGMFNLFGGFGILVNSAIGGALFTNWTYAGPFLWMSILNIIVAAICHYKSKEYKNAWMIEDLEGNDSKKESKRMSSMALPMVINM